MAEGDRFRKGQALVQVDSAKSVFDFEAPCDGLVIRRFHLEGETLPLTRADHGDRDRRSGDARLDSARRGRASARRRGSETAAAAPATNRRGEPIVFLGFGGYLPQRVVTNEELVAISPKSPPNTSTK